MRCASSHSALLTGGRERDGVPRPAEGSPGRATEETTVTARTEPGTVVPRTTRTDPRAVVRAVGRRTSTELRRSGLARAVNRRVPLAVARAVLYYRHGGRIPRILRPRTFTEKVTWRICFDRREQLSWTCDKLRMKEEARRRDPVIGIPRTLWH